MKAEPMNQEQWQRLEQLYHAALECDAAERSAYLATVCVGDEALLRELESLIRCDVRAERFIETPAVEIAAQLQPEAQAKGALNLSLPHITPISPNPESLSASPVFIGHYRILRKLGEGGMGVVYEAEQQRPCRPVALKVVRGGRLVDEYQIKLFQREVRALARLKHPGIAAIYESGVSDDGQHFFAMELVRGVPLLDYVKGHRLVGTLSASGIKQRLELFLKVCDAISYAHQRSVIHRDLKPANILVADDPEKQNLDDNSLSRAEVKILDFGLARITDEGIAAASGLSSAGQIKGTLPYMSPEQLHGEPGETDVRTDVYTLGVILYELLTERFPYELEHATLPQAIRIICEDSANPLNQFDQKPTQFGKKSERIDRDVETIVFKAMEKDPARRYQSVTALSEDVARYLANQPIHARPPNPFYQLRKLVARHKLPFLLLAVVFLLLLGFALTMAAQSARIRRERDKALAAERMSEEERDLAEQARTAEQKQRLLAEANSNRAEEQRLIADQQRLRAEQEELSKSRLLYGANMSLAQQAWEQSNLGRMQDLLGAYLPKNGHEDMRGFEWHYLWRLAHSELLNLSGHSSAVNAVAFSPDGKWLATGSRDHTVKLWDAITGQELLTIKGHEADVSSVSFSPDGKHLVTGSWDRTAKVWDATTGRELLTLNGHSSSVSSAAFSLDGKRLVTGGWDRIVKVWDVASGQTLLALAGHTASVSSVAFSPDGKRLMTGSLDRTAKVWDATTGQELLVLKGHTLDVYAVAFSPDGKQLVTGSWDHTVKVWDAMTGHELRTLKGHEDGIFSIAFSSDGKRLVTGSMDTTAKVWDVFTGHELLTLKGHSDNVRAVAFSPDGKRFVSGSDDRTAGCGMQRPVRNRSRFTETPAASSQSPFHPMANSWSLAGRSTLQSCGMWLQAMNYSHSKGTLPIFLRLVFRQMASDWSQGVGIEPQRFGMWGQGGNC